MPDRETDNKTWVAFIITKQIYSICNYVTDTRSGHPRPHKTRLPIVTFALFGTSSALIAKGDRQFTRAKPVESFALCH